jgi:RHS repeat-associated protein
MAAIEVAAASILRGQCFLFCCVPLPNLFSGIKPLQYTIPEFNISPVFGLRNCFVMPDFIWYVALQVLMWIKIQNYSYAFDDVGNVISRDISFGVGSSANLKETFLYDDLHRVTSRTVNTKLNLTDALAMTESYGYDGNGNLTNKTNVGYYQYNVTGKPNRLAAVWTGSGFTGTKSYSFTYDNNGNVANDGKRTFTYTPFDKPSLVTQGTDTTSFSYGPNRELIKRIDVRSTGTTSTLMLDGYEQITLPTGVVEHKYNVGDAIITKRSNGANETYYLHKDQQGSTTAITNAAGTTVQQFLYDPWGKQYLVNNSLLTYTSPATSKGYTGHEMVNDFEVIHMGGRTYNPVLGRFMQADPFIQFPNNLQSYNRYSYVLNNPMSYTDPSGYFSLGKLFYPLKSMVRSVMSVIPQNVGNFLISIGSKFCGPWAGACAAAATYEFSRAHGMSRSGALRAAAAAGVAAYAFGKVADSFGAASDANIGALADASASGFDSIASNLHSFGGNLLTAGQIAGQVTAHAVVGGIVSSIGGGKFGHGFFSAGVTKGLGTPISDHYGQGVIGGTITSMVIGGTASVISGGKFANGARTAAYQYLFNYARSVNYGQIWRDVKGALADYWGGVGQEQVDSVIIAAGSVLEDGQAIKAEVCAGFYIGGCAALSVTNDSLIFSRGAGRVFGASFGGGFVPMNADKTNGVSSWSSGVSLLVGSAGYELDFLQNATPQPDFMIGPVGGFSINHTFMRHTVYKGTGK